MPLHWPRLARRTPLPVALPANENPRLCASCGDCCSHMPGSTAPQEWGKTKAEMYANIVKALASGDWTLDWWEGDPRGPQFKGARLNRTHYLRPAMKNRRGLYHAAWGGEGPCAFLERSGCALPADKRPVECRALQARGAGECEPDPRYGKRMNAMRWIPYQDMLEQAADAVHKASVRSRP